jgi:hypothetical protein
VNLPPFPTDDTTLAMLEAAIDPWSHGHPEAVKSSLWPLLEMVSQLAGSDTRAVAEQLGENTYVMRDPQYTEHGVITALIAEIRRLRADPPQAGPLQDQIRDAVKDLLGERGAKGRLAARVGITRKHLSEILHAHTGITAEMADRLFAALDCHPVLRVVPLPGGDT